MSPANRFSRHHEGSVAIAPETRRTFEAFTPAVYDDGNEREQCVNGLPEHLRGPARQVLSRADDLAEKVGWKTSRLLEALECHVKTTPDLEDLTADGLARCDAFLALVDRAMELQGNERDRRRVTTSFGRVLRDVAEGPEEINLKEFLFAGDFPAWKYLELGEISTARKVLTVAIRGDAPAGDPSTNPYDALPTVHISTPRLEAVFVRRDVDSVGEDVFGRIEQHVLGTPETKGCKACQGVVASLRRHAATA